MRGKVEHMVLGNFLLINIIINLLMIVAIYKMLFNLSKLNLSYKILSCF